MNTKSFPNTILRAVTITWTILFLTANCATWAAISASTVWEVRVSGSGSSDTNGGGFVTGASGTDWSQQDAVKYALTGVTTAAANAIMLTASASTDMVGNILNIVSGTNFTVGWYQITAVSAGVSITVDRNCTTAAGALGVVNIGGALASPGKVAAIYVSGNIIYIKSGTYSITSTSSNISGGRVTFGTAGGASSVVRVIGYGITRGDNGTKPLLQASGISSTTLVTASGSYHVISNIAVDGASLTSIRGVDVTASNVVLLRGKASNCTNVGLNQTGVNTNVIFGLCEATGCSSTFAIVAPNLIFGSYIHDNTFSGLSVPGGGMAEQCVVSNCSGASSDGITISGTGMITNCTIFNSGRDGLRVAVANPSVVSNTVSYGNTGFGFNAASAVGISVLINCAGGSNTGGNIGTNVTYASEGFVTLSGDPFVASGSSNFALNNTAGAGASCRAAGIPGAFPGGTTTGYIDIGAVQHQDAGGPVNPSSLRGGFSN